MKATIDDRASCGSEKYTLPVTADEIELTNKLIAAIRKRLEGLHQYVEHLSVGFKSAHPVMMSEELIVELKAVVTYDFISEVRVESGAAYGAARIKTETYQVAADFVQILASRVCTRLEEIEAETHKMARLGREANALRVLCKRMP